MSPSFARLLDRVRDGGLACLRLRSPFTIPSGVVTTAPSVVARLAREIPELGFLTTKTVSLEPRAGYREPIIYEYHPGCFINAVGIANPGARAFVEAMLPLLPLHGGKALLVSIMGSDAEEFVEVATILDPIADAFELNLSCPHVKGAGQAVGSDPDAVRAVVARLKERLGKPVIPKLSPNLGNIPEMSRLCEHAGADAIALINTVGPGLATDCDGNPVLSNVVGGLSGAGVLPIGIRAVRDAAAAVTIPLIASGGISSAQDVRAYARAGASLFAVGSGLAGMSTPEIADFFRRLISDLQDSEPGPPSRAAIDEAEYQPPRATCEPVGQVQNAGRTPCSESSGKGVTGIGANLATAEFDISGSYPPTPSHEGRGIRKPSPLEGEGRVRGEDAEATRALKLAPMGVPGDTPASEPPWPRGATTNYESDGPTSRESAAWSEPPDVSKVFGRGSGGQPFFKRVSPGELSDETAFGSRFTRTTFFKTAVAENAGMGAGMFRLTLQQGIACDPGQFFFLRIPGEGEKPFSPAECTPPTYFVRAVGPFTRALESLEPGAEIFMRGPYGRGFPEPPPGEFLILVGGGTGIAPVIMAGKRWDDRVRGCLLGFSEDISPELDSYLREHARGSRVFIDPPAATGEVVRAVAQDLALSPEKYASARIYVCGPAPMMKALLRLFDARVAADRIFLAREDIMRCGIGLCGSCATEDGRRSCVDGPVMNPM
ncbi:MAG: hypothetical protein AB1646_00150 [Thermodesulfobacteriota bacterium]